MVNSKATVRIKTKSGIYPVYIRFTKKKQTSYIKTAWVVNEKGLSCNKEITDPYVYGNMIQHYFKFSTA